ncbi:hypothetical protein EUGRSUZ_H03963 [Eucalyptus grandis]|uniref:Uncharacterized protein n=2 Tax=Eucalyptus grandis TaxID=71139 RepID=A0A059B589_EUCGR|nr:hypothetical protein EUGRSUZ_H03963 [Eucalyptus grandis]
MSNYIKVFGKLPTSYRTIVLTQQSLRPACNDKSIIRSARLIEPFLCKRTAPHFCTFANSPSLLFFSFRLYHLLLFYLFMLDPICSIWILAILYVWFTKKLCRHFI